MKNAIQPRDDAIIAYHQRLQQLRQSKDATHEGNVRHAFANLLEATAQRQRLQLVQEHSVRVDVAGGNLIRYDGVVRDEVSLPHGFWEAKDSDDNLEREIQRKRERGYSFKNIIFEDSQQAILYQRGDRVRHINVNDAEALADLLNRFYHHQIQPFEDVAQALDYFKEEIPHIAGDLKTKIDEAHRDNRAFQRAFAAFMDLCRAALNPNIREAAVDEMLIQHLLTERLIRRVFDVETFTRRNVIAHEIESVIDALSSQHFSRSAFLGSLDHIYKAIEAAADEVENFTDKQRFLNTIYERFFQGYSVKVADTHGIVYTPQEIVEFMCASVEQVLRAEFELQLGDPGVRIIDPATGTGNFIVNLLNRVDIRDLDRFYREQLFANEVMLMPYYIASLNIEHAYYTRSGRYESFEGLSFVDTLELAKKRQMSLGFFTEKNAERVQRQQAAPLNVILGNPPYNVGQLNENDNNKNRAYDEIDQRIRDTYVKDSKVTNKNVLYDAYVRFFRWATDRLEERDGVVCFVTNNSFVDSLAFDGMRQHLLRDFSRVYVLDLHGNVRLNPKLSGTTHNVFGIQVGVAITVAVRRAEHTERKLFYHRVPEDWTAVQKLDNLIEHGDTASIPWRELKPDARHNWILAEHAEQFAAYIPLGDKAMKAADEPNVQALFKTYSRGVATSRDAIAYDFDRGALVERVQSFIHAYNAEVERYERTNPRPTNVDDFVDYSSVRWSRDLKADLKRGRRAEYAETKIRRSLYRPFTRRYLFFDTVLNEEVYGFPRIFPTPESEAENRVIALTSNGSEKPFMALMIDHIPDLHLVGAGSSAQCFPFYVYDADGQNRRENITDWALEEYRQHSGDAALSKWDVFYMVYALLHHPTYRARYAANLKRDLPRLPRVKDVRAYAEIGRQLADWHLNYETVTPYRLKWELARDDKGQAKPLDTRVAKMRLKGKVKPTAEDEAAPPYSVYTRLQVNDTLTLADIPPEAFAYRLGNRSALEWVVDQYQVKTDKRSGITSDPNAASEDERYIVELVEKVVAVSVETVKLVAALSRLSW